MSTKILGPVWDLEIPTTPKFVLVSLADQANDQGWCWPSIDTIRRRCCFKSARTVQEGIRWLEAAGYIEILEHRGRSNSYQVNLEKLQPDLLTPAADAPPQQMHPRRKRRGPPQQMQGTPAADAGDPRSRCTQTVKEPSENRQRTPAPGRRTRPRDEIWDTVLEVCGLSQVTPTKSERGAWNTAVKQLREIGATPDDIRARAKNYRHHWPNVSLTPTALARHWNECRLGAARQARVGNRNYRAAAERFNARRSA